MQFDDIKKQLPFTVSSTDTEYLSLVAAYLKNPADAISDVQRTIHIAANISEVCQKALKGGDDDRGA